MNRSIKNTQQEYQQDDDAWFFADLFGISENDFRKMEQALDLPAQVPADEPAKMPGDLGDG